jgi:AcrR family transcriptional regulator
MAVKKNKVQGNHTDDKGSEAILSKSEKTKDSIMSVAKRLFIERGYDSVSIKDITDAAGLTKGHVYYYFENKQALFDAVLDSYFSEHARALMNSAKLSDSISERINSAVDAYIDFIERNPGFPRLIQRELCSESHNTEKISRSMSPLHEWGTAAFSGFLPVEGPLSAKHFFMDVFAMIINYYTYAPLVARLWGVSPLSDAALSERRKHLHIVIDGLVEKYVGVGNAASTDKGNG